MMDFDDSRSVKLATEDIILNVLEHKNGLRNFLRMRICNKHYIGLQDYILMSNITIIALSVEQKLSHLKIKPVIFYTLPNNIHTYVVSTQPVLSV